MENTIDIKEQLKQLDFLSGTWHTEGTLRNSENDSEIRIKGTDEYEWFAGGHFLVHRANVLIGNDHVVVIEMIGYDEASGMYSLHSFDNKGNQEEMKGVAENGVLKISGHEVRATLTPSVGAHSMTAVWERLQGTEWIPWMDMRFAK